MKILSILVLSLLSTELVFACPEIAGKWNCYESSMDYKYKEEFLVQKNNSVYTYTQILTDEAGEQPTFEKITDSIDRLVSHLVIEDHDWNFHQKSYCPQDNTLVTHEVVERSQKGVLTGKSSADFVIRLETDGTLSMITNAVEEDGSVYDNDFVGKCQRL